MLGFSIQHQKKEKNILKNALILDVESTISNKGNVFDLTNKLVCIGLKKKTYDFSYIEYLGREDFSIDFIQEVIDEASILVGFNIKFDLHWLRKIGIDISNVKVWDCQLAEFLLNHQQTPYPSLDQAAEKYGFNKKLDIVKTEYWDKGIDTDQIPHEVLTEYLKQDLLLTQQVFEKQYELLKNDGRYALFRLQCQDLLVLEEMEWNGIKFETEKAKEYANEIEKKVDAIYKEIYTFSGGVPLNLNSNDHLSALLYGGTIVDELRIPIGVYATGKRKGQPRYKIVEKLYTLPRIVEPLEKTETEKSKKLTAKDGRPASYWEVNETVLRKLKLSKEAKKVIALLDRQGKLEKLKGTYLLGYGKLIEKMNWEKGMLHGTLNQCVAITGRLSSTKPNLQNMDGETKMFMTTRYA